jgi:hypothetical protein
MNASLNSARPAKGRKPISESVVKDAGDDALMRKRKKGADVDEASTPKRSSRASKPAPPPVQEPDDGEESSELSDAPSPPTHTKSKGKARLSVHVDPEARAKVFDGRDAPEDVLTEETQILAVESELAGLKPLSKRKGPSNKKKASTPSDTEGAAPKKKSSRKSKKVTAASAEPASAEDPSKGQARRPRFRRPASSRWGADSLARSQAPKTKGRPADCL